MKLIAVSFPLCLLLSYSTADGQTSSIRKKAKRPEKVWALTHPFIAPSALSLTKTALTVARTSRGLYGLDTTLSEGSLDAFRHAFWMACLAQKHSKKKALALGDAHEKSNYRSFQNKEKEHGIIPDKPNSDMDRWNNRIGAEIGAAYPFVSLDSLKELILKAIAEGKMRMIKRQGYRVYLDCEDNVIPPEKTQGIWDNPKCLVPSFLNKE